MADTGIVFGNTGTYKSSNLGYAAEYLYEVTGLPGRLICSDANGWNVLQPLVNAGVIDPLNLLEQANPWSATRRLGEGAWWNGKAWTVPTPDTLKRVGWYLVDTLSGMGDILLENLRQEGRQVGQDVVGKWIEKDPTAGNKEEKFCNNPPSHYNIVQRELLAFLKSMSALPVRNVLYAAHEAQGETEDTRSPIRGPAIIGKAATAKAPKELGFCVHMEAYAEEVEYVDQETKTKIKRSNSRVRAFFMSHPDPILGNVMYNCNPRVPPEAIGGLLKRWPNGYFTPTLEHGLDEFMRVRDELVRTVSGAKSAWRAEVDARRAAVVEAK